MADDPLAYPGGSRARYHLASEWPVATFRPTFIVAPVKIKNKPWQQEQWTGGAYAFYRPGHWLTVCSILQRPHGCILFADEHLAEWKGFMEVAVNTGEAAADALEAYPRQGRDTASGDAQRACRRS